MKSQIYIIMISLCMAVSTYAQTSSSTYDSAIRSTYHSLLYTPGMNMRSGAETIISLHKGLTTLEDNIIGTRWFSESDIPGKSAGVAARFAKYALLDVPLDYFSVVLGHEYFGHGSRYREFDMKDIHYGFSAPPPYGGGGGEATHFGSAQISYHQLLAIWTGGVEIHPVINRNLSFRWMTKNEMNYREASQYFWAFQIQWTYILDTPENIFDGNADNDIRAYTRYLNSQSTYLDPETLKMSVKDLKSKMMLNAANPFVFYSLFSILKIYLWDGEISNRVPTISLGDIEYLPSLRAGFTPFGVEYHLENYFRYKGTASLLDIGCGDQTFHDSWGGLGIEVRNIYSLQNFTFDVSINLWNQPGMKFRSDNAEVEGKGIGGALAVKGYYDIPDMNLPVSLVLELGYKSIGFIEGYSLDSSPIFAVGIAVRE